MSIKPAHQTYTKTISLEQKYEQNIFIQRMEVIPGVIKNKFTRTKVIVYTRLLRFSLVMGMLE